MAQKSIVRLGDVLKEKKDAICNVMDQSVQEREFFAGIALAFKQNPQLAECLQTQEGKTSVIQSLQMVASTGLSLNPQRGEAALVPYKGKCTYQIMKDGYVALAMRTKRVQYIAAEEVYQNDKFSLSKGMSGDTFEFEPNLDDRGPLRGFFAAVQYVDDSGMHQGRVEWMTVKQMEEHRDNFRADKYQRDKEKQDRNPWGANFAGMGRKTVLKRLLTKNKISDKLADYVGEENRNYSETYDDEPITVHAEISPAQQIANEMGAEVGETVDTELKPLF